MLWTEITKLVTRDGKTLAGVQVRDWLKARRVLPDSDTSTAVSIVTDKGLNVVLRSRDEVTAWLLEMQLAQSVVLSPLPVGDPTSRAGARGRGPANTNALPLTIEFVDLSVSQPITRLSLAQVERKHIAVRVGPAPRTMDRTLEIAFLGAKIRSRDAIRSVIKPSSGYRYLSRVRVTSDRSGLLSPIRQMSRAYFTVGYPTRKKGSKWATLTEFTLLGLEAGVERIQASLLNRDGTLACSAVLEIAVSLLPNGVGALRIFHASALKHFKANDPELAWIHPHAPSPSDRVRVGVCDTGVFDDTAGARYLSSHWVAGHYFDSTTGTTADRDTKPVTPHRRHILDESPSLHGTNVAGQAVWGAKEIDLVDVMVQRGQEMADTADAATARAFEWARDQGAAVVNCSKVVPFRKDLTRAFVEQAETKSKVLFVATGGNSNVSFPLNTTKEDMPIQGAVNERSMPICMVNTLWGGGCKKDRTPHPSRGHGPAIEVMVPSDDPPLYSPSPLRAAYRAQNMRAFRAGLLAMLDREILALGAPPPTIVQGQTPAEADRMQQLHDENFDTVSGTVVFSGLLGARRRQEYEKLQAKLLAGPNPVYAKKQAYVAVRAEISGLPTDDLLVWADDVLALTNDLASDSSARGSRFVPLHAIQGDARAALVVSLRNIVDGDKLPQRRRDLAVASDGKDLSADDGVSFGLPVIANIAAKLKLIRGDLTPNKLKRIIIDTSDIDPGFETQCIARGIVNPLRAYLAAYDNDVSEGGRPHHDYRPVKDTGIAEARRVYYTFFYMDAQGLALYQAIKGELRDSYHALGIDLVEAEPPVRIQSEPLTYVTGRAIHNHDWKNIVPPHRVHPLVYANKHLRLVLVNQVTHVEGTPTGQGIEIRVSHDHGRGVWTPPAPGQVEIEGAAVVPRTGLWFCAARIGTAADYAKFSFAVNPEHVVSKLVVYTSTDVHEYANPSGLLNLSRIDDRRLAFSVTDPTVNGLIVNQHADVGIEFGVVQRVGGNAQKCNIFVNNSYHGGHAGTPDAYKSALVLLQHEIGHALGMVPGGHPSFYNKASGYGGDGNHCGFNTEVKPKAGAWAAYGVLEDSTSDNVKVPVTLTEPGTHANDVPCVMYHTRSRAHHRSKFCDDCKGVLRGHTLEGGWHWDVE